jgi:hypothetical protein
MTRSLPFALAALLAVPTAAADAAKKDGPYRLDLEAAAYGGAFDGYGIREQSGGMAIVEVSAQPEVRGEALSLEVPLRIAHRETFGTELSETTGAVDLEPWWQATRALRVGLDAGLVGASRPDWEDLYQRNPTTGALAPTDRYGYLAWRAGLQLYARPGRHQHLRASYRFVSYDYVDDPEYNPNVAEGGDPMHLTPGDQDDHKLDVSWSYRKKTWALALRLDYTRRNEQVLLARSARTGSTRAAPGSPLYSTPLQRTSLWEPSAELTLEPATSVELSVRYGYDVQDDLYQGYYSYGQHHPRIVARWAMTRRLAAAARYEGWFRTYGPNSTEPVSQGGTRKLDYGDRRVSSRFLLGGEVEYALRKGLVARARVEFVDRGTNYYDYVPPPEGTSSYDIDWDYTNLTAFAGIEYRL